MTYLGAQDVQELQDLFTLVDVGLHLLKQFWLWCDKWFQIIIAANYTAVYASILTISDLFFLLMYEFPDNFLLFLLESKYI